MYPKSYFQAQAQVQKKVNAQRKTGSSSVAEVFFKAPANELTRELS
jgi:hypothetical protein